MLDGFSMLTDAFAYSTPRIPFSTYQYNRTFRIPFFGSTLSTNISVRIPVPTSNYSFVTIGHTNSTNFTAQHHHQHHHPRISTPSIVRYNFVPAFVLSSVLLLLVITYFAHRHMQTSHDRSHPIMNRPSRTGLGRQQPLCV